MGFGSISITPNTLIANDISEPGSTLLTIEQLSNTSGRLMCPAPTVDSDGSPLTGITGGQALVLPMTAEAAIELGLHNDWEAAAAVAGAQPFTFDLLEGGTAEVIFAIDLAASTVYCGLARFTDDVAAPTPT